MEFYSDDRFQNWLKKISETEIDEENTSSLAVFDQMLEDIVIACLNILRAVKEREIKKNDAIKEVEKISSLIKPYDFNSELKNTVFQFTVESIKAVLMSFKYYLEGKSSKKDFHALLKDAIKKEQSGNYEAALDAIARMGVKILKGETLPELEIPEDSLVLNWLDGIDAISAVIELGKIDASEE